MMKNRRPQRRSNHSLTQVLIVTAGLVLMVSAPCTLAEHPTHSLNVSVSAQIEVISEPVVESGSTGPSRAASATELERAVRAAAQQHHLHPALLFAVMKAESSFNPIVVSKAGAVGLMQLVPETAMRHGVQNLYDTNENVAGGARHLRYLLDRFHGNTRLALAAYNAGERKVDRYKQIPPYKETRHYVQKVLSYYRDYRKEARLVPLRERQEGYTIRTL
jgi:soluble lytic murein transglycosylase-like protein